MRKNLLFAATLAMLFLSNGLMAQDLTFDFEAETTQVTPEGWTLIDADGDENNWYILKDAGDPIMAGHSGTGFFTSASYAGSALTPDNWLITPKITVSGSVLTFWVCAQDATWAGEKYGIYISTTDTEVESFTELMVETLTAKGDVKNAGAKGTNEQGAWYEKTVDLSEYTGDVYLAFRHFDCTDMFRINLDDVVITNASLADGEDPEPSEGITYDFENGELEAVPVDWSVIDADGDTYNWFVNGGDGVSPHAGSMMMSSASYINDIGALTPDNWVVTPVMTLSAGATISWYVQAQDANYAGEKYGVYVSTGDATDVSTFTELFTETMVAKSGMYASPKGTNDVGTWYERQVDLSDYASQAVSLAFRHFDCTDMFYLNVDDVVITNAVLGDETSVDGNLANAISVYPVPARDVLNVATNNNFTKCEVYNVVGQVISRVDVASNNFQINTSELRKGVYFIRLSGNGITSVAKFIVR